MKYSRSRNSLSLLLLAAILLCGIESVLAQTQPILHLDAGQGVVSDSGGVSTWTSTNGEHQFDVGNEAVKPSVNETSINGYPAIEFKAGMFFKGPDIFPVGEDYTLYVVVHWSGAAGANNLFSGRSRALYLASSPNPRVLHNGNFGQQATSAVAMVGPTIIRVEHIASAGGTKVYINNELGVEAVIPQNTDASTRIAAYNDANFFDGAIAEIILFDEVLQGAEKTEFDEALHAKYSITRMPDPVPPPMDIVTATQDRALIPDRAPIRFQTRNIFPEVKTFVVEIDSNGYQIAARSFDRPADGWGDASFDVVRSVTAGLHVYGLRVRAITDDDESIIAYEATDIVSGEVIAIEGQSNSIFNDATLAATPWARTFGSNFGRSAADTTFKRSIATGNGGGANVGGWGLYLQNQFAQQFGLPTCVINGGVGGTRIEAHFPDANDRFNQNTIYGSWLYRLEKSGLRDHVRWLFWYQGESNAGADNYDELFDTLYRAWKEDLPNLEQVVVIQIRPGCGGADHATLRDDQRSLEQRYEDVLVHTACALPGHDGCHFTAAGYRELGNQLFNIMRDAQEAPSQPSPFLAPRVSSADYDEAQRTIAITFDRAEAVYEQPTPGRTLREAFFLNGDESLLPDAARTRGSTVILDVPEGVSPNTVSYVPSKHYPGTTTIFAGPWVVDERGVGALSFNNLPLVVTSVEEVSDKSLETQIARKGEWVELPESVSEVQFIDVSGRMAAIRTASDNRVEVPKSIETGLFLLQTGQNDPKIVGKLLVIP